MQCSLTMYVLVQFGSMSSTISRIGLYLVRTKKCYQHRVQILHNSDLGRISNTGSTFGNLQIAIVDGLSNATRSPFHKTAELYIDIINTNRYEED